MPRVISFISGVVSAFHCWLVFFLGGGGGGREVPSWELRGFEILGMTMSLIMLCDKTNHCQRLYHITKLFIKDLFLKITKSASPRPEHGLYNNYSKTCNLIGQ
jgi:hypothetical protein